MHNILFFVASLLALPISALPTRQVDETVQNSSSDLARKDLVDVDNVNIPVDVNNINVPVLVAIPVNADVTRNPITVIGNNDS